MSKGLRRFNPAQKLLAHWDWVRGYSGGLFADDCVAAIIVTVLLVPQALAYAILAGLPPYVGIYASIIPLVAYAVVGSSRQLAVGPTAVVSLLTAAAIASMPEELRVVSAAALALMTGGLLFIFGLLRAGFIMNFVSRPVVSAYVTGSAILIIMSQIRHILGIEASGGTSIALLNSILENAGSRNMSAVVVGVCVIVFLLLTKRYLAYSLVKLGLRAKYAKLVARVAPIVAVTFSIIVSDLLNLSAQNGLRIVGDIPSGLPYLSLPGLSSGQYEALAVFAIVIALVAFVDSMSIAQTFAARTRTRIDANKELVGLGVSNMAAGLSGGYPVSGSFSRSAVNFSAGAKTPIAGILTAGLMALTALFLTPLLKTLPLATLAAMIITACFSLINFKSLWNTWKYSRADGITAILTFLAVLGLGVQWGVLVGVVLAMALHIRLTLKPHMAIVGRFLGTEHYRDAKKYNVETHEEVITLRIDESLYYANARYLEDKIARIVAESPKMTDLILMCPAVNHIDASALSSLTEINRRLKSARVDLHFSELHSHVQERLFRSTFMDELTGQLFLSQHEAIEALEPEPDWTQFSDHVDIH
ncbi:MAG: SulP family inorganic anion transporter [Alphaproteobacteria bacterium]